MTRIYNRALKTTTVFPRFTVTPRQISRNSLRPKPALSRWINASLLFYRELSECFVFLPHFSFRLMISSKIHHVARFRNESYHWPRLTSSVRGAQACGLWLESSSCRSYPQCHLKEKSSFSLQSVRRTGCLVVSLPVKFSISHIYSSGYDSYNTPRPSHIVFGILFWGLTHAVENVQCDAKKTIHQRFIGSPGRQRPRRAWRTLEDWTAVLFKHFFRKKT